MWGRRRQLLVAAVATSCLFLARQRSVIAGLIELPVGVRRPLAGNNQGHAEPRTWLNADCLQPLDRPILGTHDLSRILNMGMPKMGSSSLAKLFSKNFFQRHFHCGRAGYCGSCMREAAREEKDLLVNCGNFTVWTQMDHDTGRDAVYPQIQYLAELYEAAPHATFLLPFRNISAWVNSMTNWDAHGRVQWTLRKRFEKSAFPEVDWTRDNGKNDSDYNIFFCNHVRRVRTWVADHPSLSLIEFSIDDPHTGDYLASLFPVDAADWGKANENKDIHPSKALERRGTD
jgi:hypothetical protein